ncbi:HlyD family efflux transporter periplasmic adaptor subunit [Sphingomonas sp. LB-2]|uniref:efflux RND transporter periplasmic adaptor subunit n=1 Tax=Sphingomonas caeni TaxID=2984949 RepID=UPI0022306394|nr:HlyD family efflux transporter periplasmic adaptor subunit [Sphingomonas caeni]MCW3846020.1 HlyD family efflux transporter periplasmic adaptor subunit [Sphingomonas caeni]
MRRKLVTGPRILVLLIAVVLAIALFVATRTPAVEVEAGEVARGPMAVTIDDLAETRVRDLYMVSAPITGELLRVPLKPGARVVAGETLLARIRPAEPGALDARALAQIQANVRMLEAQAAAAHAQVEDALAAQDLAERQLTRTATLRERGFVTQAALDAARATRDRARAAVHAARQGEWAARESVNAARAGLIAPGSGTTGRGVVEVRAPVSGTVLTVPQESMRVVVAGTPLVSVGDPAGLEMVTDLLSADAVQVRPGAAVSIEDWGGARPLKGRVRLVEPFGFLKVSALGVEEQRVNVVIDFAEPREAWTRLGHGFRATVRIETWRAEDAVLVPISALFRSGSDWQVFRISGGVARAVSVRIGRMNADAAQVLGGLAPGDRVILHPGDKVADGVKVRIADGS